MSIAIVVCTHGKSAKQMVSSVEMIMGKQENVSTIDFIFGDGTEDLKKKYLDAISKMEKDDGVLFLVDLLGGSPFNVAATLCFENENYEVITGVNIPMLIEVLSSKDSYSLNKVIEKALNSAKESIVHLDKKSGNEDEDSF